MPTATQTTPHARDEGGFRQRSSLAADVWHPDQSPAAYEWWYFDALSDDGRDALVVIFLADFVFSPRYNRAAARDVSATRAANAARFPALAFCLYRDGRPLIRAVNEYSPPDFEASVERPACRIGASRFTYDEAARRFNLQLEEPLRGKRLLQASLSWNIVEGDFSCGEEDESVGEEGACDGDGTRDNGGASDKEPKLHEWNLVAPRCRVVGDVTVCERRTGRVASSMRFGGDGYHDHNRDRRWLPSAVASWQWGRAHFEDATAVFYRFQEHGRPAPITKLFVVRGGRLAATDATFSAAEYCRDLFGLRYPAALRLAATDGATSLEVSQRRVLDRSYFYLRFLCKATLELDGVKRRAPALTEHLAPRALRWRTLDWLTDMRIGRNGRTAFLK